MYWLDTYFSRFSTSPWPEWYQLGQPNNLKTLGGLHDDNHRHYHLILTNINKCSEDTGVVYLWFIGPQRAFKSMTQYRCRICFAYSAPQSTSKQNDGHVIIPLFKTYKGTIPIQNNLKQIKYQLLIRSLDKRLLQYISRTFDFTKVLVSLWVS